MDRNPVITPLHGWIRDKIGGSAEGFDRSALAAYRLERLGWTVDYARAHSPFYREKFSGLTSPPRTLVEFQTLPFTSAAELQDSPTRLVCVPQDEIQRIVTLPTSGTSGPPKRIYFTADDLELTVDFFRIGMSSLTRPGDRVLILFPGGKPDSIGALLAAGLTRLGCTPIPCGPFEREAEFLALMREKGVNVLAGAPVQLNRLAVWDQYARVLPEGQVRAALASSDVLPKAIRNNLVQIWGCEVFDHYGMTESGLGGGVECDAHQGYHLREADLFFEIIDPDSGELVPDGEMGEVVLTTLTRRGMPLIRYRTGDLSRFISGPCPCGTWLRRLENVRARVGDGVRLDARLLRQVDLDEVLFRGAGLLDFRASVEGDILRVAVRLTPQGREEDVHAAVGEGAGFTDVNVLVEEAGEGWSNTPGKRRIGDQP